MQLRKLTYMLFICGCACMASSCKKKVIDGVPDPTPEIIDVVVSPSTVVALQDSIVFDIAYRDSDGDLGENEPNARNLFLVDNRINVTESFRIRELAPSGTDISITGTLRVVLRNTGITDNSASQKVNYTIYLRDRVGNESAHFVTSDITVVQ